MKTFLLVGQSNMAGRGRLADVAPIHDPRIRMFRDGEWCAAVEPLHTDKPDIAGVGLGMSFALTILAANVIKTGPESSLGLSSELELANDEQVGLIPCAVGGTALSQWQPGADLFEQAVETAQHALGINALQLSGILWHQGEADVDDRTLAETYAIRLQKTLNGFRERLSAASCPLLIGCLGDFMRKRQDAVYAQVVNDQIHSMPVLLDMCQVVSAAGLHDNGDILHFDAVSLRVFGERYAAAYLLL